MGTAWRTIAARTDGMSSELWASAHRFPQVSHGVRGCPHMSEDIFRLELMDRKDMRGQFLFVLSVHVLFSQEDMWTICENILVLPLSSL